MSKTTLFFKDKQCNIAAFFLPVIIFSIVLVIMGFYPFGEKTLLVVDMNSEYIDYFARLNEAVRTGGSVLRSWKMGMGYNMLGLIAFYTSSIANAIILITPVKWITEAVMVVTLFKLGLCGSFFATWAKGTIKADTVSTVMFSTIYALCGYNMAYTSNIMWLDGVAMLPLVLLGCEHILRHNRYRLFLWSLVYLFYSSYYIGYMVGVFSFLYFTIRCFQQENDIKYYFSRLLRFVSTAVLAAGCCAFLLIPAFLNLKHGQSSLFQLTSPKLTIPLTHFSSKLLPGVYDTIMDAGLPNVYVTILGVLLLVIYFMHSGIPLRERCLSGVLVGVMLLSFSSKLLNLAWHAFETPTWFPARFSFVFCFLTLALGLRCFGLWQSIRPASIVMAVIAILVLFIEIGVLNLSHVEKTDLAVGLSLVLVYGVVLLLGGRKSLAKVGASTLIVLICAELAYNAYGVMRGIDQQFTYKSRESYFEYRDSYSPVIDTLPEMGNGAYRTEILEQRNSNGGLALGYNPISHYSTTTDQNINSLLRRMGYNTGTINDIRFSPATPPSNGLLGIRYVLATTPMGAGYELVSHQNGVSVYENTCTFPLAFFADYSALDYDYTINNPFELPNEWINALWDNQEYSVFTPIGISEFNNVNLEHRPQDTHEKYSRISDSQEAYLSWVIENTENAPVYVRFPVWKTEFSRVQASINGGPPVRVLGYRANPVLYLGSGDILELKLTVDSPDIQYVDAYFYALDLPQAQQAATHARDMALDFHTFTDTRVRGSINAPRDGLLLTTFPYDSGWSIEVDGKKVQPKLFDNRFIAISVEEGLHEIKMSYLSPGFALGCIISVACLAGILCWYWITRKDTVVEL